MGLCKCPKKKVTNLFCFEHTVNVCEYCLVSDHPRCVVLTYLRWLQDSDYDPSCRLCGKNLNDETCGPCVRLLCYDIFHWTCLDRYERGMPPNTAPAGFTCPTCTSPIFPPPNSSSPVAIKLHQLFSTTNWARNGLGLPMLEDSTNHSSDLTTKDTKIQQQHQQHPQQQHFHHQQQQQQQHNSNTTTPNFNQVEHSNIYSRTIEKPDFLSGPPLSSHDSDTDKYKRRPTLQILSRWFSNMLGSQKGRHQSSAKTNKMKRYSILVLLFFVTFFTILLLFQKMGRHAVENDPMLDPLANPNIRVQSD